MAKQDQFLNVIDRDEAEKRFREALNVQPLECETVEVANALGRILAADVIAQCDVPAFDRSNYDGFAVRAADTYGATEESPCLVRLGGDTVMTATVPAVEVEPETTVGIVTGAMLPRGADSVVMIEDTDCRDGQVLIRRAITPGYGVTFAGTDISARETVLWRGERLSSRETGVLAAIGETTVEVIRRVNVGVISTGDEIIEPGQPISPGLVFDSNARILADAVRELGAVPHVLGIVRDDSSQLREVVTRSLNEHDVVLLSGGTSKGVGDISYRVVRELTQPGIVAHGVALKPGKPVCLAVHHGKPVVVLPGFPTSAIFTFHEFVAPVIQQLAGQNPENVQRVPARLAVRVNSEVGRTEYLLVGLVSQSNDEANETKLAAYPMGKGSGSVTTFSRADGFVTIGRHQEIVEADEQVQVQLLSPDLRLADLVVIGSHCIGLDYLLGQMQLSGWCTKFLAVGSTGGLEAARRGECDVAGMHLLDPETGQYNLPFISGGLQLIPGYHRMQGIVYRTGDPRFEQQTVEKVIATAVRDPACVMINRNRGSGTRVLIDRLLDGAQPVGYAHQARNHNAVAAAVCQGRADWGLAIQCAARHADLGFLPITEEQYDFVVPQRRAERPAVQAFGKMLADPATRSALAELGCRVPSGPGP